MNILLVESSKALKLYYESVLQKLPFTVGLSTCETAELARYFLRSKPDLDIILIGDKLDDMPALHFCKLLNLQGLNRVPMILLSSALENQPNLKRDSLLVGISEIFLESKMGKLIDYLCALHKKKNPQDTLTKKILLVQDSASLVRLTSICLEPMQPDITAVESVEAALTAIVEHDFDLIITDNILKGTMTGFTLINCVRHFQNNKNRIPILVLTATQEIEQKLDFLIAGASDFVHKTSMKVELLARARSMIQNKKLLDQIECQTEALQHIALTDQLTQLNNRHFLMSAAPEKIHACIQQLIRCSMMVIDLDHFKFINDRYGHATGDMVLQEIASALKYLVKEENIVARFGGEEFIILLSYCDKISALSKAEQLRKQIEQMKPNGIDVSVSIGVSSLAFKNNQLHGSFDTLFRAADEAVYRAKELGRNQVRYHPITLVGPTEPVEPPA